MGTKLYFNGDKWKNSDWPTLAPLLRPKTFFIYVFLSDSLTITLSLAKVFASTYFITSLSIKIVFPSLSHCHWIKSQQPLEGPTPGTQIQRLLQIQDKNKLCYCTRQEQILLLYRTGTNFAVAQDKNNSCCEFVYGGCSVFFLFKAIHI